MGHRCDRLLPPPPRQVRDMSLIDQKDGEVLLQKVINGFPVDPCAFHRHMGDLQSGFRGDFLKG